MFSEALVTNSEITSREGLKVIKVMSCQNYGMRQHAHWAGFDMKILNKT